MKLKKFLLTLMCVCMLVMLAACGNAGTTDDKNMSNETTDNVNDATDGNREHNDRNDMNRDDMTNHNGGVIDDVVDGVGEGVDDVTDGVENAVDDITDRPQNETTKQQMMKRGRKKASFLLMRRNVFEGWIFVFVCDTM